jgi:uncharacterized lipoprotein YddW (UPF0748 family)
VERIIKDAENNNLNTLFVQVHGRADAYYNSDIEPRSETLKGLPLSYDPLKEILESGHAAGLEVHAWVNAYYAWNRPPPMPVSPDHVVNRHPDWLITDDEGRRIDEYSREEMALKWVEGLYLDPARRAVRDYLVEVSTEIVRKYPVDGIHLDFIRYPGSGFGFNTGLMREFARRFGIDPLLLSERVRSLDHDPQVWLTDDASIVRRWNHYYYALWNAGKARAISDTVRQIYESIKSVRPQVVLSAAVFPDPDKAYYQLSQDWRRWLRRGYLDIVVPMAYHGDINRVRSQVMAAAEVAGRDRVYAGLGAWIKEPSAISAEIAMLRQEGIKGFSLFSYKGMSDKGTYLRDLRYRSIPPWLRLPKGAAPGKGRASESATPETVTGWLDRRYDWSSFSREEAVELDFRFALDKAGADARLPLLKTAVAAGFRASKGEISEYLDALEGEFYSRSEFTRALDKLRMNPLTLDRFLEQEIILNKYITARCYSDALPEGGREVQVPASADISYILRVAHPKDGRERRQSAKKLMEEILRKLNSGADFASLAKTYSQGGNAGFGGRAGTIYYSPGNSINEIIFSLGEGEHSRVVEGYSGFLIYKVNSIKKPFSAPYQSLPWKLKRRMFQERLTRCVEKLSTEAEHR